MGEKQLCKWVIIVFKVLFDLVFVILFEVNVDFVVYFWDGLAYIICKFDFYCLVFGEVFFFDLIEEDVILEKLIGQV